jgi:TolB-like protein/Tfp pilus assembly protein PilF
MSLVAELQRRSVFKVAAAYLVVAWLVVQAASIAFPLFEAPTWALRVFVLVVALGFPVALVLAWAFEITPEGVRVDTAGVGSRRIFVVAGAIAALALGWYFVGQPAFHGDERGAEGGHATDERSIAVLPFVNMSNDPEQEFFSDGIAEELLNRLAQFPDLKVAARTSAFQFKGKNLDVAEIGRQLKVAHVLEGSVRKSGTRLRITAQLIDSATGYHLWSQTYERDAADVFKVQDEIAGAIADSLKAKLGGTASEPKPAATVDPAAYDDYLQARAFLARRAGYLEKAVAAFDRAIARDPNYSPAHSGRALTILIRPFWDGSLPTGEAQQLAEAGVAEALRLDPDNAEAYMVRATVNLGQLRVAAARADMARAEALAPGSVDVMNFHGDVLEYLGDFRGAERLKRQAMALDPLAYVHPLNLASILIDQGRYPEAASAAQRAIELGGDARGSLLVAQLAVGDKAAAERTANDHCKQVGDDASTCVTARATLLAARGELEAARTAVERLVATPGVAARLQGGYSGLVDFYANWLGDIPRATAAMRIAIDAKEWFLVLPLNAAKGGAKLPEEISTDPEWLAVWNDPRLAELMTAYRANIAKFRQGG